MGVETCLNLSMASKTAFQLPPGDEPRILSSYSLAEAAQYLRNSPGNTPLVGLRTLYPAAGGRLQCLPLLQVPNDRNPSLSFLNLVEAHVLDALRREHKISALEGANRTRLREEAFQIGPFPGGAEIRH